MALIDIGTGIVGKLVDLTVGPVVKQVKYVFDYNQNAKDLENKLNDLVAESQSVQRRVDEEIRNMREVEVHVYKWMTDVKKITSEANEIFSEEHKRKIKCLCGLCPNLMLRHQLSRRSTKLVSDIAELDKKKDFRTFSHAATLQDLPNPDYEAFGSRTLVVNQILDVLRNCPNINMIGLYGLGGVGKTTLVKEVSRHATGDKTLFDDVALIVDVKQDPSIRRIQKAIAEKLELALSEDDTVEKRARLLYSRIKDKKTLIILDDVRERICLEDLGVFGVATCKVLVTSRTREVLSIMHTQKDFSVDLLGEDENWKLFEKKAGKVIEDPAIKAVATKVAKKCEGLPVLIVTVASALKNKSSVHVWKHALGRLEKFDKEEDFTRKTYLGLEWSYDQLSENLKSLFLLCGFYTYSPKMIHIQYLLKYGIGLGYFKNLNSMGEIWHALNSSLEELKDSCLLLDHEEIGCVKMHDLVHDVAKGILSRDKHVLKVISGEEFTEWPDPETSSGKGFYEKCSMISLRMSSIPKLPEVLPCTNLKMFNLTVSVGGLSPEIPNDFFKETANLSVLDLTSLSILSLPPSLKILKSLKTLCLDWCTLGDIALIGQLRNLELLSFQGSEFKELPKEISQLTRLRSLDLSHCSQLELISPNVLSSLEKLEELRMGNSFTKWEVEGDINDEKINASLSELKQLSKLSFLQIHISDACMLPTDLFSSTLDRYHIYIGDQWKWDDVDKDLNTLKIKLVNSNELNQSGINMLLKRTEELHINGNEADNNTAYQLNGEEFQQLRYLHVQNAEFEHIIKGEGVFPYLKKLAVRDLDGPTFLLSSSRARSLVQLTHLEISGCQTMEEIVSTNELTHLEISGCQTMEEIVSTNECAAKDLKDMFSKLQHLKLNNLPNLTRFCSTMNKQESYNEVDETADSREILGNVLFDNQVVFASLKQLFINGLTKLTTIWHNQLSPESFKSLETVKIQWCGSLKSVFPASMVRNLQQLIILQVSNCGVEEIVANEDGLQTTHELVFSKMKYVTFRSLPQLRCFKIGMHASRWPSLETLAVDECSKDSFLAQECPGFERTCDSKNPVPTNLALFLINKDSFPNLKRVTLYGLDIWDGPLPVNVFSKLEYLEVGHQHSKSAVFEKFLDLKKRHVTSTPSNEISLHEDSSSGNINTVGALPHLSELWLHGMPKLMHLGEDYTQSGGQNIPKLENLYIWRCDSLRSLNSSAISFKNLTILNVYKCPGLVYLISYSIAKSFIQLKRMTVDDCARLINIVGGTKDNDALGNEIVFSRLIYLELSELPRLRGFSSEHCIVKFPFLATVVMSKRLKSKIFPNDGRSQKIYENDDTDVESDEGERVTSKKVDNDGAGGEQIDEAAQIENENEDTEFTGLEHDQPLKTTATNNQGVIAPVEQNLAIIPVAQVTTPVFPVIDVTQVRHTAEVGERAFKGRSLEPPAEKARTQTPNIQKQLFENQSDDQPSDASIGTPTQSSQEHVQPLETTAPYQEVKAPVAIIPIGQVTTHTELPSVDQAPQTEEVVAKQGFSVGHNLDPISEEAMPHVHQTTRTAPEQPLEALDPLAAATGTPTPIIPTSPKSSSLIEKLEAPSANKAALKPQGSELDVRNHILLSEENIHKVTKQKVDIDTDHRGEQIDDTNQGVMAPVEENLAIIPIGEVTTPVFPVVEPLHGHQVPEQAFSAKIATPHVHQTPNVDERSDPLESSAAAKGTPTPIIPSYPNSSGVKRSLREKLEALSANKAASSSGLPEAKARLKAFVATSDLKDPHTRQHLLDVLPTLQESTTKWIADLAVQELSKLPLVLDKEETLCQELAALKAQGSELDERSHILLSQGSLAEENIHKVQEQKVELLALEEQIKKLEAQATSLRAEIANGEKRYSGFEASLDQLVEEQKLNQVSIDSASQELLRTRAVTDSLCTAIFTYLRQLL